MRRSVFFISALVALSGVLAESAAPFGVTAALAQTEDLAPAPAPAAPTTSYGLAVQGHVTVRADRTATAVFTRRFKILTPASIQPISQQQLWFVEGMQSIEVVEAFTEKADGRQVPVGPANMIIRDGSSGLQASYTRDLKQRVVIFPDVEVGDTLVMTYRKETRQGLFPGQFYEAHVFARSQAITSAQVIVEAPRELDLQVKTIGTGLTATVEESGDVLRTTATLAPQAYVPEEAGAVAAIDRDPALLISTFKSYEEMGLAYGAAALGKAAVTPEIVSLADEITRGIDDRRAQATAIDAWMKKNIRYVAVYLALGRVVPNDATTVLQNKFGDCKDKVALMAALLAAKGIASEAVLINSGTAYTLPEPPTMAVLNHAILYLPELDLYDDPTASAAAFGVLPAQAYDKPVVRVSAEGVRLARTPPMRAEDHTIHVRTTINVAADGKVTGRTEQTSTGVLGGFLRGAGARVQNLGNETSAQRLLQGFNTPGTGRFELGNSSETLDPVTIRGSFALNEPFKPPAAGLRAAVPSGLPMTSRLETSLLGRRLNGRKSAFSCFAGRQTEDIDVTFDPALPMPIPLAPRTIDNAAFSYRATFKIEGRTLKIRREFVSRVARQVCPPELEAQIAGDLNVVRINVTSGYGFGAATPATAPSAPGPRQPIEVSRAVAANQTLRLEFLYSINPDCSSIGLATVRILEEPKHGKITVANEAGFTNFQRDDLRYECNKQKSEGVAIRYQPEAGYTGTDSVSVDVIFASGSSSKRRYSIEVK
jgi:hypothetical protein